jgi:hypothetical protein
MIDVGFRGYRRWSRNDIVATRRNMDFQVLEISIYFVRVADMKIRFSRRLIFEIEITEPLVWNPVRLPTRVNSSGSFATLAAIRRASSLVSSLAAERQPSLSSK